MSGGPLRQSALGVRLAALAGDTGLQALESIADRPAQVTRALGDGMTGLLRVLTDRIARGAGAVGDGMPCLARLVRDHMPGFAGLVRDGVSRVSYRMPSRLGVVLHLGGRFGGFGAPHG